MNKEHEGRPCPCSTCQAERDSLTERIAVLTELRGIAYEALAQSEQEIMRTRSPAALHVLRNAIRALQTDIVEEEMELVKDNPISAVQYIDVEPRRDTWGWVVRCPDGELINLGSACTHFDFVAYVTRMRDGELISPTPFTMHEDIKYPMRCDVVRFRKEINEGS